MRPSGSSSRDPTNGPGEHGGKIIILSPGGHIIIIERQACLCKFKCACHNHVRAMFWARQTCKVCKRDILSFAYTTILQKIYYTILIVLVFMFSPNRSISLKTTAWLYLYKLFWDLGPRQACVSAHGDILSGSQRSCLQITPSMKQNRYVDIKSFRLWGGMTVRPRPPRPASPRRAEPADNETPYIIAPYIRFGYVLASTS